MKKTILVIVLLVVVAGVSGGGVYLWQKSKKTSPTSALTSQTNLKTYTNEKYSYQLNYPDNVGLAVPGMISPPADSKSDDIVFYEYTKNEILNLNHGDYGVSIGPHRLADGAAWKLFLCDLCVIRG